ncbi:TetR/AcrR family transcriptional regulator [Paraconexibacter sp. AEG42_29]|uniref:TetR/AcrR family transcriptional regulator n=1 Tax=Paraconexibacter sp. AEG42_29 TaxID=2997339 RepID=UPI00339D94B7
MPKVVDHEARRAAIVAALWRVVQRDGMAGTSVRTVAAEAGISAGALRHYFGTQDALLRLAVESMTDAVAGRVQARLTALGDFRSRPAAERLDALAAILEEVAPLDARRRAEFEVWLELVLLARTSPDLRPVALAAHRDIRSICVSVVMALAEDQRTLVAGYRDPVLRRRTDALHGLLDGLCLHLALYPGETSGARVRAALREHLEGLA